MRSLRTDGLPFLRAFALTSFALPLAAALSSGCYSVGNDCNLFNCSSGGGGATTAPTGGGGTGGTGAVIPTDCIPKDSSGPVADGCGIFVSESKGSDENLGTKASPLKTLAAAIERASQADKRVYACAESFTAPTAVSTAVTVFGALDCTDGWTYLPATRTTLTAAPGEIPLHLTADARLTAVDLDIFAADAVAPGGSSIAILAEAKSELDLTRSEVVSGLAAPGNFGQPFGSFASDGEKGSTGVDACTLSQSVTPDAPVNRCGDTDSVGGSGGNGASAQGSAGNPGEPAGNQNGGAGETAGTPCKAGTAGLQGIDGAPGSGGTGMGTIDETGYLGAPGEPGKPGTPGQGGGGGGGSRGGTGVGKCTDATKQAGASGGSGGSGGCGGQGGNGGGAGGSSIAILSLGATFLFNEVTITAKSGGAGGAGGDGQGGGVGGGAGTGGTIPAGATLNPGCPGGPGASGGSGGKGGGGQGGHSIALAHTGAAPDTRGASLFVASAGNGGAGDGVNGFTEGEKGIAAKVQSF
ncbi:MAG: PGRS family protein [Polyangiaceae bacterium]